MITLSLNLVEICTRRKSSNLNYGEWTICVPSDEISGPQTDYQCTIVNIIFSLINTLH